MSAATLAPWGLGLREDLTLDGHLHGRPELGTGDFHG